MNLEHLKVIILIQILFPQLIASALSIIIILIEKQEADKMKLTTCICSRTHCSRDESTPLKRPGHLILAACINIKKGISETKITVYKKWELEFWGSRVWNGTLRAEMELSPQLSQSTPSKSKAYRSPIPDRWIFSPDNYQIAPPSLPL